MRRTCLLFSLIIIQFFLVSSSFAQGIKIGAWREHLPYSQGISVAESSEKVYCATEYSVFSYNKTDNSLEYLSPVTGLSDVGVRDIAFHEPTNTLIVAYQNANIDLVKSSGRVINVSDIYRKSITGNKTINAITLKGDFAYLACGFGIVVLDMQKQEIKDTYIIGPQATFINVYDIALNDTAIFAATEAGLFVASDYQNVNLLDFRSWQMDTSMLKPDEKYTEVALFDDMVFVINDHDAHASDTIYYRKSGIWDYFDTTQVKNFFGIRTYDDEMMIISGGDVDFFDASLNMFRRVFTYVDGSPNPRDVIRGQDNTVWIADNNKGLVKSEGEWRYEIITPEGPQFINSVAMDYADDKIWVATGGTDVSWGNLYNTYGVARFSEDDGWRSFYYANTAAFDTIFDIMDVAVDPYDSDHLFAASWGRGLVEMDNGSVKNVYTDQNSTIEPRPQYRFMGLAGLAFDDERNLWVTNSFVNNGLSMRSADGTWRSFDLRPAASNRELGDLVIDDYGQKWIVLPRSGGIAVFNDNGTLDNTGDDDIKRLTTSVGQGALPSNEVVCLAKDKDGEIWVGTDEGVAVFYTPGNVFSGQNFDAQQIFIPRNDGTNTGTFLLETETVTEIYVDGANRKWIGTTKAGLYLMSPEGTEQIHHFTTDNSPLLSDNITSITMNEETGELFVGTDKGIISFRTEATAGAKEHSDVYAYPNPVPPNYNGKIAVKGLVTDANVKITDVSGNLIYQTIAKGGQAIWNGKNFHGEKAHSGVYLVFSSNEDGEETFVAKILFLR